MKKSLEAVLAFLVLSGVTACDYADKGDLKNERADKDYRVAMDDYRAGRIPQAIEGLQKVCRTSPANASARFQLACLLQDSAKDYFGAACAYREYIQQHDGSEKTSLAKDRLADCTRELAKVLAEKYGLNSAGAMAKEADSLRSELKGAEQRAAKLDHALEQAKRQIASLQQQVARLNEALRSDDPGETAPSAAATSLKDAKALLDEEDATAPSVAEAKALAAEDDAPSAQTTANEISAARALASDADEDAARPLEQAPDAKERRDAAKKAGSEAAAAREAKQAAEKAAIPDTYVVQDGDTLYKIAIRFYGHYSAWSKIRDANRALISTDGRVKAGQRLVLPK